MAREEEIKTLLISILETIADATDTLESDNTDRGTIHLPELRYVPAFEFLTRILISSSHLVRKQ